MMGICNIQNINTLKALIISLLLFSGCAEQKVSAPHEIKGDLKNAFWITDSRQWPLKDADMYGDIPAPLFRKDR